MFLITVPKNNIRQTRLNYVHDDRIVVFDRSPLASFDIRVLSSTQNAPQPNPLAVLATYLAEFYEWDSHQARNFTHFGSYTPPPHVITLMMQLIPVPAIPDKGACKLTPTLHFRYLLSSWNILHQKTILGQTYC